MGRGVQAEGTARAFVNCFGIYHSPCTRVLSVNLLCGTVGALRSHSKREGETPCPVLFAALSHRGGQLQVGDGQPHSNGFSGW